MSMYEPCITEVHFYCDDYFVNGEIKKKRLSNIKFCNSNEAKIKGNSKGLDFSFNLEYFDEEKVDLIIGKKLKNISKEYYEMYFINSKEELYKVKDFKGLVICVKNDFDNIDRKNIIFVKEYQQALNLIYCIYFSLNSYHIIPYDIGMFIKEDSNIITQNIAVEKINEDAITVCKFKRIISNKTYNVVFINTNNDYVLERKNGLNLYNKILEKIDKSSLNDIDSEVIVAMNYTKEIGEESIG